METDRERLQRLYAEKKAEDLLINNKKPGRGTYYQKYYQENKEKIKANHLVYYTENKEKKAEYYKEHKEEYAERYQENKERVAELRRLRYPINREKHLERNKKWREENPEKCKLSALRKKEKKQTEKLNKQKLFLASL